jgi:PPM family protein phosphatase
LTGGGCGKRDVTIRHGRVTPGRSGTVTGGSNKERTMMAMDAAGATDQGRVRRRNEDAYFTGTWVFAVADGLGGHPAGDVASHTALEPLAELDARGPGDDIRGALVEAVTTANAKVRTAASEEPARSGMGTTLTAVAVTGEDLTLAHVGDSRCYLLRDGGLQQLSLDHTPVQFAVDAGRLDPEAARSHPERHVLAQAIGLDEDVDVDTRGATRLRTGDVVLLCTDGLTEMLTDDRIAAVLSDDADARTTSNRLVADAVAAGGVDNVTVVVLRFDG